jgi:hypothetical protein
LALLASLSKERVLPLQEHTVHIDAQPDIQKMLALVKAVLDVPADAVDSSESAHMKIANELIEKIRPDVIRLNIQAPGLDNEEIFARTGGSSSLSALVQLLTQAPRQDPKDHATTRDGSDAYISPKVGSLGAG